MRRTFSLLAVTVLVLAVAAPRTWAISFKDQGSLGLVDHLDQPGDAGPLDATFGSDGRVITAFGPLGSAGNAVAIQADGKIVVCGTSGRSNFALARYGTDGTLDPSFGEGGKVAGGHAGAGACYALAIQTDGKIVAGGGDLSRYNPDGTFDSTFGENGIVTRFGGGYALAIQTDGKIVAGGGDLSRYNPDGTLDTTFGPSGVVGYRPQVAIQTDGRIVVADYIEGLFRFDTDGTLDTTFGGDGTVDWGPFTCCSVGAGASNVAVQPDGKIVSAGDITYCFPGGEGCETSFLLMRHDTDGMLDTSFNGGGISGGSLGLANAVAIQVDGKIVTVGACCRGYFVVLRHNSDGTLDTTFAGDGRAYTTFTDRPGTYATAVALQADGKIVVVGGTQGANHKKFALARYLAA
jgi:uncharacterized delta-60 repeat protein